MLGAPEMSKVAQRIFGMFGRMEFAMKRCPAYRTLHQNKKKPNGDWLQADWTKLAKSPSVVGLWPDLQSDSAAHEMIAKPPKRLTLIGASAEFGNQPDPCTDIDELFVALKTAWNNLFHGEKGNASQPREIELLTAGIFIMDRVIQAEPDLLQNYWF